MKEKSGTDVQVCVVVLFQGHHQWAEHPDHLHGHHEHLQSQQVRVAPHHSLRSCASQLIGLGSVLHCQWLQVALVEVFTGILFLLNLKVAGRMCDACK